MSTHPSARCSCRSWAAVEAAVIPALRRVLVERRSRLGLEPLRPWDLAVNPYRTEPLRPYEAPGQLPGVARRIFGALEPALGAQFQLMMDEHLLDLESRRSVTWPPRAAGVVDPTGAVDAFAGGFLSAVITGGTIDLALARGVVSASFAIEAWGPAGLLGPTLAGASRRPRDWFPAVAA